MTHPSDPLLLAPIVLKRQRMLVPATLAMTVFYTFSAKPMGIALPAQVLAYDYVIIAWLVALTALVMLGRIPARCSHTVSTAVWVGPTSALLATQYCTHNPDYIQLIVMSVATAGVMLNLRHVVASLVVVNALTIPLIVRDVQSHAFSISVLIASSQFALMVHFLIRGSLLRAETHRLAEAETARQLATQLTALERSHFGLNAADAMSGNGNLKLSAVLQQIAAGNTLSLTPGSYVRIACTDTGVGMDAATRRRVFEPFFTTKPLGRGTGLGLSTVWGIAQAHQGTVDVESEPGKGATFSIYLPTTSQALAPPSPVDMRSQAPGRNGRILVVDDEPMVRDGTSRILKKMGFEIATACDGAEGVRAFLESGGAFELVVLDMRMPIVGGPECFAELRKHSQVPILIATGYAVDTEAQALVAAGAGLIEKPFRSDDLVREVTRMIGSVTKGQEPIRSTG